QVAGAGKTLYRNKARDASGTGLDDLADAVLSSGLSSERLRRHSPSRARFIVAFCGAILIIVLLSAAVFYFAFREKPTSPGNVIAPGQSPAVSTGSSLAQTSALPKAPNFCGIPLEGPTVIYVLDRGDSS